jgi:hypothetical protein
MVLRMKLIKYQKFRMQDSWDIKINPIISHRVL